MAVSSYKKFNLPNLSEDRPYRTERIYAINGDKIRIRHFFEITRENVLKSIQLLFSTVLEDNFDLSHIESCEVLENWKEKCKDIVVTFDTNKVCESVFSALQTEESEMQEMLGVKVRFELGKNGLRVWKQAAEDFCSSYMYTSNDTIHIVQDFKIKSIHTLKQYREYFGIRLSSLEAIKEECEETEISKKYQEE